LQQIIYQDAWLLQIRIQIMQPFVDGPRYGRSYALGHWSEYFLICRQYLTVCVLVGIADWQRGVAGRTRACAHEERCYASNRPVAPYSRATHQLNPCADDWSGTAHKASARAMPLWRVVSDLSALSYQLFFGLTVALLPQCFISRRCRFMKQALLPLRRHQSRLENDGGRQRRQQRQAHQLAHAGRPRMV
jgi:hypothetical protein